MRTWGQTGRLPVFLSSQCCEKNRGTFRPATQTLVFWAGNMLFSPSKKGHSMNTQKGILPGFTAGSALESASAFSASNAPGWSSRGVEPSQTQNCNCGGSQGNPPPPPPGACQCSSIAGVGCSVTGNSCNPGFVPNCSCGLLGNSCQCVSSLQ